MCSSLSSHRFHAESIRLANHHQRNRKQYVAMIVAQTVSSLVPTTFVNICARLAPPLGIVLCAAPIPTIRNIKSNENVGSLPLLPYSCMVGNCFLWSTYGLLKHQASIWGPNLIGTILALYYCRTYIKYSPKSSPTLPGSVDQHVISIMAVFGAVAAAVLCSINPSYVGQTAVIFCIALFASPLAALKTVVATKSAKSIPWPFTIASVINCFLWSVTGAFKLKDWNVIVPNTLGLAFGLAQIMLKLVYGNRETDDSSLYARVTP